MRIAIAMAFLILTACGGGDPPPPDCAGTTCTCAAGDECGFDPETCGSSCSLDCEMDSECSGTCLESCSIDCATGATCDVTVGASGSVSCVAGSTCHVTCTGSCSISCAAGASCDVTCPGESEAQLVLGEGTEVFSETEVVGRRVSVRAIIRRLIGRPESRRVSASRRNLMDIAFERAAPGVRRARKDQHLFDLLMARLKARDA